ncbi:MAG: hypothetical protein Rubg2KO_36810 [Rubricoccaceae bacterium]
MKTALITIGLTAAFFGVGLVAMNWLSAPADDPEAEDGLVAASDSTAAAQTTCPPDSATVAPLVADVEALQMRLASAEAQADSLRRVMAEHQETAARAQTSAAELAATLTKMEDEALGGVVQRLDGRSFVKLYSASTSRNQGRLLGALTPAQAAAFVRSQLPGGRPLQSASTRDAAGGGVTADSTDDG